ncbi:MAG: hypothetical protein ACFFC9_06725 [Promethearchaeota archaeon]
MEKNNEDKILEEEKQKIREKLEEIQEGLKDQLDEIKDEIEEKNQELKEERDEIREELEDDLEDLRLEEEDLRRENVEIEKELKNLNNLRKEHLEDFQRKMDKHREKVSKAVDKFTDKAKKKLEKAERKAAKRINISVDPEMSDDWKDWAEDLGTSVSELVRKSMEFVKDNVGDLKKLNKIGKVFEQMGGNIELAIKESGLEDLGEKIENEFGKKKVKVVFDTKPEKERIKKRVSGLIKLLQCLPIEKLAQALEKSNEDAENLLYELVDEGIKGTLEEGVFKFTTPSEEVISKLNKLIDKM